MTASSCSVSWAGTDPGGWVGWLATHHEFYWFIIFYQSCIQLQSQEHRSQNFPRPPSKNMLSKMLNVVHKLCELSQHYYIIINLWCYLIFVICIWKTHLSWNLNQPPTSWISPSWGYFLRQILSNKDHTLTGKIGYLLHEWKTPKFNLYCINCKACLGSYVCKYTWCYNLIKMLLCCNNEYPAWHQSLKHS